MAIIVLIMDTIKWHNPEPLGGIFAFTVKKKGNKENLNGTFFTWDKNYLTKINIKTVHIPKNFDSENQIKS